MSRHLPTIHTWSIDSIGYTLSLNLPVSAAYPTANAAYFFPIRISYPYTATLLFSANGATASGNIDMGIYDDQGTRLVSIGSTAQSGTNTTQSFDITNTLLLPGTYYLAVAMDNTTGTLFRIGALGRHLASVGARQQLTAFPLPATATFARYAPSFLPLVGMTNRTFV